MAGDYSYWAIGGIVALESMGVPLPGEATLIAAAAYAGKTGELNIGLVIAAAALGAMLGDNIGFWIGREAGYRLLLRYGGLLGLTEARLKVGQYLFLKHGGKIVFIGRFVTLLRAVAALLAGVNRMNWPRFLLFNAAGAIAWACVYGIAAYKLGHSITHVAKPALIVLGIGAVAGIVAMLIFAHRREADLIATAEKAIPGPLRAARMPAA